MSHKRIPRRNRYTVMCWPIIALAATLSANIATADDDPRYDAVKALGALNGIALQCKYIDQVRRMKTAVVLHAPKERSFGLAFDEATNDAFLAFAHNAEGCPARDGFERQVGHRIDRMAEVFAVRPPIPAGTTGG